VAEAALNLACVGAKPLAVTDCLNFGNPERPEILGQFAAAIRGLSEACRVFETPVVSGNVSLYNETDGVSILATPTVGMVGLLDDVTRTVGFRFAREGDLVALLGTTRDELGAGEYLATILGRDEGPCPSLDFASARALVNMLLETVRDGMLSSAHDVSEGGLAVALAEAAMGPRGLGADVNVKTPLSSTRVLFSQTAGRALVSLPAGRERNLVEAGRRYGVATALLGRVVPGRLAASVNGVRAFDIETSVLKALSESAFERLLEA
jgi:phosphoribosylformylglycinamidine synthase